MFLRSSGRPSVTNLSSHKTHEFQTDDVTRQNSDWLLVGFEFDWARKKKRRSQTLRESRRPSIISMVERETALGMNYVTYFCGGKGGG